MRGGACWDMTSTLVQGNHPRPLGGYQPNVMLEPHSPAPAWHMHTTMKQEPMDEDRNDSGINSGSDFHSSSPGSDNSQEDYNPAFTSPPASASQVPYYATPVTSQYMQQLRTYPGFPPFNPLTPPSSDAIMSPREIKIETATATTTLTPRSSPNIHHQDPKTPSSSSSGEESDDPLRRLRMSFEKDGFLPSVLSPKTTSEHSNDDENVEEGEGDEENIRAPKVNSHGKVKTFKCKQCDFVAITKLDFWDHSKMHIKTDKLLTCPKCPFVTEYKHHLEYHLRNHFGSKPFKCDKCNYSCVNKSMLNSHMKSHSNIYQYRCSDCSYATKYCHSLKLHLRKYSHKPAMVLNPDGTPNPLPIIDVYGTRRGPKMKQSQREEEAAAAQQQTHQQPPNPFAQLMMGSPMNFPYPFMQGFPGALTNPMFFPQLAQQLSERNRLQQQQLESERMSPIEAIEEEIASTALDLSKAEPTKSRRKGRAYKIERSDLPQSQKDDDDEDDETIPLSLVSVVDETPTEEVVTSVATVTPPPIVKTEINNDFVCQFCKISFGDLVLYTMHMGYHGYKDPFTCNMCGEQCTDKVAFFLHIARNPHT